MIPKKQYVLLNVFHVVVDGLRDSIPILLAFIVLAFGAGEKAMGLIVSLTIMVSTLAGLSTIVCSRRFGFVRTQCLVMLFYGLGYFLSAFAGSLYAVALCFIVAAVGHGVFHNIAFSYITCNTERNRLGKVMSDFTAIGDIGRIPLVSLAGFGAAMTFFAVPGWRIVCAVYGFGALLFAVCLAFSAYQQAGAASSLIKAQQEAPQTQAIPKKHLPQFSLLRERELGLSVLASVLNTLGGDMIFVFLPMLLFAKGLDPKVIGTFAFGFTLGSFVGKMACGRMVDLFGTRAVFICSELLLAFLLILLVTSEQLVFIVFLALLIGIVTRGTVPVVQTIITEPVKYSHQYDDVFAINTFLCGSMNILTPLLFGVIAAKFGIERIYLIMACAALCAVVPVFLLRKRTL